MSTPSQRSTSTRNIQLPLTKFFTQRVGHLSLVLSLSSLLAISQVTILSAEEQEKAELAQFYGFLPLEVFRLSDRSANLVAGDFNSDGQTDIACVDNGQSRIDLLLSQKKPHTKEATRQKDVNAVDDHWRFEHVKLAVDQEIYSLAAGDFDRDGRTDLAYLGAPDQLVIRYQSETGDWQKRKQYRIAEMSTNPWQLVAADFNQDQLADLAVATKTETILYLQKAGQLSPETRLLNTSDKMGLLHAADVDGDGRADLTYVAGDGNQRVFCVRFQLPAGLLGPEYAFDVDKPRAVSIRDLDGIPGSEIMTIDSRTSRLKISKVEQKSLAPGELPDRLLQFGFGKPGAGKERDIAIADVDGDGLTDVLVSDPDSSRVIFFPQTKTHGLELGKQFPSLVGVDQIRVADLNGDGKAEVLLQSTAEKTVGFSIYSGERLTFPQPVPLTVENAEPIAIEVAKMMGQSHPALLVLQKVRKGRETSFQLEVVQYGPSEQWETSAGHGMKPISLSLSGTPERIRCHDLDGDGSPELLVFFGGGKPPYVARFHPEGRLEEITATGSLGLGNASFSSTTYCQIGDAPGLLLAQESILRLVQLTEASRWRVADQFNLAESNARVAASAVVDLDGKDGPELIVADTGIRKLRIFRIDSGLLVNWKEIDLGDLTVKSLQAADLNHDGKPDLLIQANDRFAVMYSGGQSPVLKELATFETKLQKTFPTDVVAGDLNHDGIMDLAITDTRSQFLEILQYCPGHQPRHAMFFKLFEEKSFSSDEGGGVEPREALAIDITGDGLTDLVFLAHDRLLVYPQDPGTSPTTAKKTE